MGLEGETPEGVDTFLINSRVSQIEKANELHLRGEHRIDFIFQKHLTMHYLESLPQHPNGMRFSAFDSEGDVVSNYHQPYFCYYEYRLLQTNSSVSVVDLW